MITLSEALAAVRARSGLTQEALAEKLGVHRVTVVGRERGRKDMPASELVEVARATGCLLVAGPDGWQVLGLGGKDAQQLAAQLKAQRLVDSDAASHSKLHPPPSLKHRPQLPASGALREVSPDESLSSSDLDQRLRPAVDEDYGLPIAAEAGAGPGQEYDELAEKMTTAALNWYHKADVLIRISGTSMEPVFYDSDVIGVQFCTEREVKEGQLVVARWRQYGTTIVKVNRGEMEGRRYLQSLNPTSDIVLGERDELEIIGRPFGLLRTKAIERSY